MGFFTRIFSPRNQSNNGKRNYLSTTPLVQTRLSVFSSESSLFNKEGNLPSEASKKSKIEDVIEKLNENEEIKNILSFQDKERIAQCLTQPKLLKKTFLSPSDIQYPFTLQTELQRKVNNDTKYNINDQIQDFIDLDDILHFHTIQQNYNKKSVRVKLLVREAPQDFKSLPLITALSPFRINFNDIDLSSRIRSVVTGLVIGDFLFEWNESSLCIPRRCFGNASSIIGDDLDYLDLGRIDMHSATTEKIASLICLWNREHMYDTRTANAQQFLDVICESLSINFNSIHGPIAHIVQENRFQGRSLITSASLSSKFKESFSFRNNVVKEFSDHATYDAFVIQVLHVEPQLENLFYYDYIFLKLVDRLFWMRHFTFNGDYDNDDNDNKNNIDNDNNNDNDNDNDDSDLRKENNQCHSNHHPSGVSLEDMKTIERQIKSGMTDYMPLEEQVVLDITIKNTASYHTRQQAQGDDNALESKTKLKQRRGNDQQVNNNILNDNVNVNVNINNDEDCDTWSDEEEEEEEEEDDYLASDENDGNNSSHEESNPSENVFHNSPTLQEQPEASNLGLLDTPQPICAFGSPALQF